MNTLSDRISWILKNFGISQSDLARIAKIKQPSVNAWVSGKSETMKADVALAICDTLSISMKWLIKGEGSPTLEENAEPKNVSICEPNEDYEMIKVFKIQCAAGNGYEPPTYLPDIEAEPKSYRRSWIQKHHLSPSKLKVFEVKGESMEPFLYTGDSVLVDTSFKNILPNRVYVFTYNGEWRIKRLRLLLDGSLCVMSEHPLWSPETIPASEMDRVHIVGRVVERSGSGGL